MDEKQYICATVFYLPYPAVDAMVAETLERYTDNPPVPLVAHFRQLSAGSSLHRITDKAEPEHEMLRAIVRTQPEDNRTVTAVELQTWNARTASTLPDLLIRIRQIIAWHRANLNDLQQRGLVPSPPQSAPLPPRPPQPGDKAGQIAILEWYRDWNPRAYDKEIADYCSVKPQTIKNWRDDHDMPKRPKKEVL